MSIERSIAIVEDEAAIARLVQINLEAAGYRVETFETGEAFLGQLSPSWPDLLILDWMLPGIDGLTVCRRLRQLPFARSLPVIMLTARSEEMDRILGLEMGADDYVSKPFSVRELVARVNAQFRRLDQLAAPQAAERLTYRNLAMDLKQHAVTVSGNRLELSVKEFDLLKALLEHPGWVYTRENLLEQVWGFAYEGETRTVDMHVANLRRKLDETGLGEAIETVRGIGYRLKLAPPEEAGQ